jgi:peptidoglycan/xylan/chitin deacetylase (PgdA/CDA1 family)
VFATALVGCPSSNNSSAPPDGCKGAQALSAAPIFGNSIATPKTLALSFDDGPASRTGELSTYLKSEGIRATFFVNDNEQQAPFLGVLPQIVADGHVIGNHTKTHTNLVTGGLTPQQIVAELTDVDTLITPYVPNGRYLFRAPFGAWDQGVYDALKASPMNKYVGHIDWESGGYLEPPSNAADVECFQIASMTSKACGDLYIADILDKGTKGIVLMHDADYGDSTNTNVDAGKGNTVDMVKYIVPLLKAAGYTFIGVDEVPDIAAALPPLPLDAGLEAGDATSSSSGGTSSSSSGVPPSSSGGSSSSGSNPCP